MQTHTELADYLTSIAERAITILESGKPAPVMVVTHEIIDSMNTTLADELGCRTITYHDVCDIISRMEISVSDSAWARAEDSIVKAARTFGKLFAKMYMALEARYGKSALVMMKNSVSRQGSFTIT